MNDVCLVLVDEDQGETAVYVNGSLYTPYVGNDELGHEIKGLSPCTVTVRDLIPSDLAYVEKFGLAHDLAELVNYDES